MLPVLLDLKVIRIYTFGVFAVLAFFWGAYLLWRNMRLTSQKEDDVFDSVFLALAGGLFLGRVVHVILHFDKFGLDILKFILINGYPGISIYGFLTGSILTLYLNFLSRKIRFRESIDYYIPSIFAALGFGKLGSFLSASEMGTKTKFFLSLKYVGAEGLRHLTPLYEGLLFFVAAFISYRLLFAIRRDAHSKGANFYFLVWFFSLVYAVFDRVKEQETPFYGFSLNGVISLFLLLTSTFYFLYYFRSFVFEKFDILKISLNKHGKNIGGKFHQKTGRSS